MSGTDANTIIVSFKNPLHVGSVLRTENSFRFTDQHKRKITIKKTDKGKNAPNLGKNDPNFAIG